MGRIEADIALKVGCLDFGPVRERGSLSYLPFKKEAKL